MAIYANIKILNSLDRLAQIREGGIQSRISQNCLISHQNNSI
jgi:hypothetical protein